MFSRKSEVPELYLVLWSFLVEEKTIMLYAVNSYRYGNTEQRKTKHLSTHKLLDA